VMLTLTGP